jgi:hypothetical protein
MTMDEELTTWRRQWHSQPAVPRDLIRRVERQTAYMRTLRVAETIVTIVMAGGVLAGAVVHPFVDRIYWLTLAAGTWLFIAIAWIISLRSTRDSWTATEFTTVAYVALHIRRLRQQLDRIRFSTVMGVLLSAFVLFVAFKALASALGSQGRQLGPSDSAVFWLVGGFVNIIVILAQMGKRRKIQAELDRMLEIERRLGEPL